MNRTSCDRFVLPVVGDVKRLLPTSKALQTLMRRVQVCSGQAPNAVLSGERSGVRRMLGLATGF